MAKVEITEKGNMAQIFIDGVKVPDVRGYSISHTACGLPVFKLDVRADDVTFDGCGFIPELPKVFKPFYEPIGQENALEIDAKALGALALKKEADNGGL